MSSPRGTSRSSARFSSSSRCRPIIRGTVTLFSFAPPLPQFDVRPLSSAVAATTTLQSATHVSRGFTAVATTAVTDGVRGGTTNNEVTPTRCFLLHVVEARSESFVLAPCPDGEGDVLLPAVPDPSLSGLGLRIPFSRANWRPCLRCGDCDDFVRFRRPQQVLSVYGKSMFDYPPARAHVILVSHSPSGC